MSRRRDIRNAMGSDCQLRAILQISAIAQPQPEPEPEPMPKPVKVVQKEPKSAADLSKKIKRLEDMLLVCKNELSAKEVQEELSLE